MLDKFVTPIPITLIVLSIEWIVDAPDARQAFLK